MTKRKVFAATASAALVASAVVPAATLAASTDFTDITKLPADEQAAIKALVDAGILTGKDAGKFDPYAQMKRSEAAAIVARILELDVDKAPSADFSDVKKDYWGAKYINAAVEAKVMEGKGDGKFDPEAPMKRAELAQIVVKTFGLQLAEGKDHKFEDIPANYWGKEAIEILYSNGLINGKTDIKFAPEERMQRNHVALLVNRAVDFANATPAIQSLSATNATDLKVTVRGVKEDLKASDFEVTVNDSKADISVTKVSNTEYTLQLTVPLVEGDKVVVKGVGDLEGSATVTYATPEITKLEGVEGIVFSDKDGQELQVKVNGTVTSVSDLAKQGYKVSFQATEDVFGGANKKTSETGILDKGDLNNLYQASTKTFKYKVSLQKDNKVVTSENVTMTISQEDLTAASSIKTVTLSATTAGGVIDKLTSGKLVSGEKAEMDEIIADLQDGRKNVNLADLTDANVSYESSDVTIATIDANGEITAGSRTGKVTITIKSGNQKKDINLEVVSAARELTTATYSGSAIKLTNNAEKELTFTAKDQYGDIFNTAVANIGNIVSVDPVSNGKVIANVGNAGTKTANKGTFAVTVTADAAEVGTGTLALKVGSKTIASTSVSVAKETGLVKQTLVKSANQIDLNPAVDGSKTITFNLENLYNGYFKENAEFDGLKVEVYDATKPNNPIYEVTGAANDTAVKIHATDLIKEDATVTTVAGLDGTAKAVTAADVLTKSETGTALVVVKDASGKEIDKINFTIVDTSANASSATFNTAVEFTSGNETNTLNLGDLISNVATTAAPHDGVLRYHVDANKAYVYYSASANVAAYNYADGDILVGVIEATPVTTTDSITLGASGAKFLANEISVTHDITKEGDKAQFNFYKRGDVSVGKGTFVKKN